MATQHEKQRIDGGAFGEILQGCATCCDGTLRAAESAQVDPEVTRLIEQARDLCKQAAERVRGSSTR